MAKASASAGDRNCSSLRDAYCPKTNSGIPKPTSTGSAAASVAPNPAAPAQFRPGRVGPHMRCATGVETLIAACPMLNNEKEEDQPKHDQRDLRAAFQTAPVEPCRINRECQRVDAKIFRCTDVVDGLHQHQRAARHDRRPRDRQQDLPEHFRRPGAERARHVGDVAALHQKDDARGEVDIRIKDRGENECRSRRRTDIGEPVVADCFESRRAHGSVSAPARSSGKIRRKHRQPDRAARRAEAQVPMRACAGKGKSNATTSQAPATPMTVVAAATSVSRTRVVRLAAGSTFAARCGQSSPLPVNATKASERIGRSTRPESANAIACR